MNKALIIFLTFLPCVFSIWCQDPFCSYTTHPCRIEINVSNPGTIQVGPIEEKDLLENCGFSSLNYNAVSAYFENFPIPSKAFKIGNFSFFFINAFHPGKHVIYLSNDSSIYVPSNFEFNFSKNIHNCNPYNYVTYEFFGGMLFVGAFAGEIFETDERGEIDKVCTLSMPTTCSHYVFSNATPIDAPIKINFSWNCERDLADNGGVYSLFLNNSSSTLLEVPPCGANPSFWDSLGRSSGNFERVIYNTVLNQSYRVYVGAACNCMRCGCNYYKYFTECTAKFKIQKALISEKPTPAFRKFTPFYFEINDFYLLKRGEKIDFSIIPNTKIENLTIQTSIGSLSPSFFSELKDSKEINLGIEDLGVYEVILSASFNQETLSKKILVVVYDSEIVSKNAQINIPEQNSTTGKILEKFVFKNDGSFRRISFPRSECFYENGTKLDESEKGVEIDLFENESKEIKCYRNFTISVSYSDLSQDFSKEEFGKVFFKRTLTFNSSEPSEISYVFLDEILNQSKSGLIFVDNLSSLNLTFEKEPLFSLKETRAIETLRENSTFVQVFTKVDVFNNLPLNFTFFNQSIFPGENSFYSFVSLPIKITIDKKDQEFEIKTLAPYIVENLSFSLFIPRLKIIDVLKCNDSCSKIDFSYDREILNVSNLTSNEILRIIFESQKQTYGGFPSQSAPTISKNNESKESLKENLSQATLTEENISNALEILVYDDRIEVPDGANCTIFLDGKEDQVKSKYYFVEPFEKAIVTCKLGNLTIEKVLTSKKENKSEVFLTGDFLSTVPLINSPAILGISSFFIIFAFGRFLISRFL
ncbi:MAG: hypothetical protein QW735_03085 [archaeon]